MKNVTDFLLQQLTCRVAITEYTHIRGISMADIAMYSFPKCTKVIYYSDINDMKQALIEFNNNKDIMIEDIKIHNERE